ncbi:hypothetical protein ACVI1N_000280 [Sinorhizobium medicae]
MAHRTEFLTVPDLGEGANKRKTHIARRKLYDFWLQLLLATAVVAADRRCAGHIFEEIGNWRNQRVCNLLETACSNAVGSFLVFLYLLKRHSDGVRKGRQCDLHPYPAHPNSTADMYIDRFRLSLHFIGVRIQHCTSPCSFSGSSISRLR